MRSLLLFMLLVLSVYVSYAQQYDKSYVPNIIKSIEPTTAKIHSYNALPISNYTGKPNISLPIFNIQLSDNLSMPLDLSYDCHIKVDDIPSRNGLGWVITMMGSVTRNIKDISDFENLEYHTGPQGDFDQGVFNVSSLGWLETPAFYINGVDYTDLMPDEYIVSAPGLSTRFVIKKNFTALELTNQLNKIDILIDTAYTQSTVFEGLQYPITSLKRLKRIILTTPLGIKYTFSLHDVLIRISDSYRACPGIVYDTRRRDVGNIYLTSIEDLSNKKKIEFEYDVFNIQDYSTTTSENFIGDNSGGWPSGQGIPPLIPCLSVDKTTIHYEQNYRVKKIKFPGGECIFYYNEQRQDLPGDYCLTGVEVKNNNGDIIKNNTFNYSYFSSLENCTQPECKRLKLDSMLEYDSNSSTCLKYKFTYNEQYQLPKRGSNLTDFLGYYNGPQEASLRKPKLYVYPDSYEKTYLPFNLPSSPATIVLPGRSMDVNEAYLKTGILTKIEYPTGGDIVLEFESNDFEFNNDIIKGGGLRVKKQILNFGNTQKEISYQYTINKNSTVSSGTIHSIPQFGLPVGVLLYKNYNDYFSYSLITRNSQSSIDVINGGYVGYKKVFVSETNNGYTEYIYSTAEDFPADNIVRTNYVETPSGNNPSLITNSGYPFTESNFENQNRFGQLKEEIHVAANGTVIHRKKNEYNYQVLDSISVGIAGIYYTEPVHYSYYRNIISKPLTIKKTSFLLAKDSAFHYAGNKTLIDATTTTYRNNSFLPWQTFSVQSDGKTSATWTTRIMDTVFQDGPKESLRQSLLAQNRLLEDVFTYKSKGNSATLNAVDYLLFGDIVRFRQLNTRASIDINYTDEFRIEQYDNKGNPTQLWSRQDNTSCLLWDTAGLQVMAIAKGNNISLARMAYTSFEGGAWGGWTMNSGSGILNSGDPLTGRKVFSGVISKTVPLGNYVVGVWGTDNTWINAQLMTQPIKMRGQWKYYERTLNDVNYIEVSANTMDEVRLIPKGAQMTTYTFDPLIGMTSQCDINNGITYYEYDGFGRLLRIRDDNKDIVKQMEYQYQIPTHSSAIWQTTGQTRCKPCPENSAYITNILQNEEKDNNPNSPTYYQTRWTDAGVSGSCTITADWQFFGSPRCRTENGVNTGQREQEKRDMNPCSPTYNQSEWVTIDVNCSTCPAPASWWANGTYRCATDGNGNNTGRRERMEVDQSRCSPTWLQFRWVDDGDACATCPRPSNWQATGTTRCQKNQYNSNTSFIEIQEQDMAACTPTYRWVLGPQNLTSCPFCFRCVGEGRLCLNDVCVFGVKVYTDAVQDPETLMWTCIYHYEWNNGAIWSQDYFEQSARQCTVE